MSTAYLGWYPWPPRAPTRPTRPGRPGAGGRCWCWRPSPSWCPAVLLTGAVAAPVAGLPTPARSCAGALPVVRAVHDVAAALTVGLLVLAATIIPETHRARTAGSPPPAGPRASAVVWVVAGLVGLVLSFADAPRHPADRPVVRHAVPAVRAARSRSLRVAAISLGPGARRRGRRVGGPPPRRDGRARGAERAGGPAARARRPRRRLGQPRHGRQLPGRAPGRRGRLGGRPARPGRPAAAARARAWPSSVARYSTLAGWCFALVALSGVQNAWIRLGSLSAPRHAVRRAGPRQGRRARSSSASPAGSSAASSSAGWRPTRAPARCSPDSPWSRSWSWAPPSAWRRPWPAAPRPCPTWCRAEADPVQALTGYPAPPRALRRGDWLTPVAGRTGCG